MFKVQEFKVIYYFSRHGYFFLSHDTSVSIHFQPSFTFKLTSSSLFNSYLLQSIYQMSVRESVEHLYHVDPHQYSAPGKKPINMDPYQSSAPGKKPIHKWILYGIPLILAIGGLIAGIVIGTHKNTNKSNSGTAGSGDVPDSASSAVSAKLSIGRFATATDSEFMVPLYPSTVSP